MSAELNREGPAAPPRRNGELVFAAPWERRLFGVTMALHERGVFAWRDFNAHLIDEIARWTASAVGFFVSAMGMGLIFHGVVEFLQSYGIVGGRSVGL